MPPARLRAPVDDSRSEASSTIASIKERANGGSGVTKSKKNAVGATNETSSTLKAAVNGALAAANPRINGTADIDGGAPQTNWSSISVSTLHTYRAAYKISTPASYTRPHAEIGYNSSPIGLRAPSVVLARKKLRDLKSHRRKLAQLNGHTNGISKASKLRQRDDNSSESSRGSRHKQKERDKVLQSTESIALSIEPPSPTTQSQSTSEEHAPSTLLNLSNPEATIIGRQSPTSLAVTVRKHFNAQQLNEAETIARFAYVARQQGYGNAAAAAATTGTGSAGDSIASATKTSAPIRVEGSGGDGSGWIMGSMGRQVRMSDSGSHGAFRLRFRP